MSKPLVSIFPLTDEKNPKIPGYFVASTAPINVEGDDLKNSKAITSLSDYQTLQQSEENLNQIANLLCDRLENQDINQSKSEFIEIIFSVHGFNNSLKVAKSRCKEIYNYINTDSRLIQERAKNLLYIGYRWPSEPIIGDESGWLWKKLYTALTALPLLARGIFVGGIAGILISLLPRMHQFLFLNPFFLIISAILLILMFLFFFVLSLIVLRIVVYFRDNYRATNFGVPDLVEFIRQLDKVVVNQVKQKYIQEISLVDKLREQLVHKLKNYLGEQTDTISQQVLERVSEKVIKDSCIDGAVNFEAIDKLKNTEKIIVLSSQDKNLIKIAFKIIEQETDLEFVKLREGAIQILENKVEQYWRNRNRIKLTFIGHSMGGYVVTNVVKILSNVFDSSSVGTLCSTKKLPSLNIGHVFCLGRLVLISPDIPIISILSGRANFLRSSLRRFEEAYLFSNEGDLALRLASTVANYMSFPARTRESGYRLGNVAIRNNNNYGIVNLESLKQQQKQSQKELLENLFVDSFDLNRSLESIQVSYQAFQEQDEEEIASLFTYFDCTDYTDKTIKPNSTPRRLLTLKKRRWEPGLIYYIRLTLASVLGKTNTHGGYFDGRFSQQVMYQLAFLGFGGFLDSLAQDNRIAALDNFSQECRQKKIQVILSSERYKVDIMGSNHGQVRREMLNPYVELDGINSSRILNLT